MDEIITWQIADDMKPSPFVTSCLTKLTYIVPTWSIVPGQDIIDAAVRDPHKKLEVFFMFLFLWFCTTGLFGK